MCASGCSAILNYGEPEEGALCADGSDNDADGLTDCEEPTCALTVFCDEGGELACADGEDNDGDGLTDCADDGCDGLCPELSEAECADGRDNDGDGLADAADPPCWVHPVDVELTRCSSPTPPVELRLDRADGVPLERDDASLVSATLEPEEVLTLDSPTVLRRGTTLELLIRRELPAEGEISGVYVAVGSREQLQGRFTGLRPSVTRGLAFDLVTRDPTLSVQAGFGIQDLPGGIPEDAEDWSLRLTFDDDGIRVETSALPAQPPVPLPSGLVFDETPVIVQVSHALAFRDFSPWREVRVEDLRFNVPGGGDCGEPPDVFRWTIPRLLTAAWDDAGERLCVINSAVRGEGTDEEEDGETELEAFRFRAPIEGRRPETTAILPMPFATSPSFTVRQGSGSINPFPPGVPFAVRRAVVAAAAAYDRRGRCSACWSPVTSATRPSWSSSRRTARPSRRWARSGCSRACCRRGDRWTASPTRSTKGSGRRTGWRWPPRGASRC
ncbi:MAG: hypothetical protein ACFCGT_03505 [Sandaracinaceae bacterium]